MNFATPDEAFDTRIADVRHITEAQLLRLGVHSIVYLRRGTLDGEAAYAIHAADGTRVAIVEDVELALELAAENGMTFVAVH